MKRINIILIVFIVLNIIYYLFLLGEKEMYSLILNEKTDQFFIETKPIDAKIDSLNNILKTNQAKITDDKI